MRTIFYLLSVLFIWVEIFEIRNRIRLLQIEVQMINPLKWIIFYVSKIFYYIWLFCGLFTMNYLLFTFLSFLGLFKFLIIKTGKDFYINLYDLITCILSVGILGYITYLGVAQ